MIDRRILVDHLPQTPPNLDVRDAALNHFRKSAQRFPKEVRGHLQILAHRLRPFGQFSQIQRTDAMTANQNPIQKLPLLLIRLKGRCGNWVYFQKKAMSPPSR